MRCLVLNCAYQPIEIISWQRAFELLCREKAETVHVHDAVVRSASQAWNVPSVVRTFQYHKPRYRAPKMGRAPIFTRDRHICQYCGDRFTAKDLSLDHVMPKSRGGPTNWLNIVSACLSCNSRKGDRTPEEANMPLLSQPRRPNLLDEASKGVQPEEWGVYLWV